MDFIRVRS